MNTRKPGRPKLDPSRDLRTDLLKISRELLEEGGPGQLSMREVARRASCTHQAPYHHFEDRESILATLVTEGFNTLAKALAAANALAESKGVRAALLASAQAYVQFALSQPAVFRIMFRPDVCNPARFPGVQQSGALAHAELQHLNRIVHQQAATPATAAILWAHVHGLACLMIDAPASGAMGTDRARRAHLREVSEAFSEMVLGASQLQPRRR